MAAEKVRPDKVRLRKSLQFHQMAILIRERFEGFKK